MEKRANASRDSMSSLGLRRDESVGEHGDELAQPRQHATHHEERSAALVLLNVSEACRLQALQPTI